MDHDPVSAPDWYPVELDAARRELTWLHLPGQRFLEPFFEDTIRRHRRSTPSLKTPLEILRGSNPDTPDPRAIFFHASRCGSTLLMQLLGRVAGCRALSEPPIVDTLLNLPTADDELISGLIHSFAKPDGGVPPKLFLKLDCWHLPHLERLQRTFPRTPCFFLYREPEAILRSHRRERGSQMVPGLVDSWYFGIDPASVNPADLDGYAERVLSAIFQQGVSAVQGGTVFPIAYSQLPEFVWEKLGPSLGLSEDGWSEAKARAGQDAKHGHMAHASAPPSPSIRPVALELLARFEALEAMRAATVG